MKIERWLGTAACATEWLPILEGKVGTGRSSFLKSIDPSDSAGSSDRCPRNRV
eukprot:jgi/Botrbrau1/19204/Bobra.0077s0107.1